MSSTRIFFIAAAALLVAAAAHATPQSSSAPTALSAEDDPIQGHQPWMIRTSRMEGAAGNVRETATKLRETAERLSSSGRVLGVAELVGDSEELNRRVQSAVLAAKVLDQRL
jgi:hypothetical protein